MNNIQFNLKFTIFDENKPLTKKQINLMNKMIEFWNIDSDIKKILKKSMDELDGYKFLDRVEPSISTIDEKKQLRLKYMNSYDYKHSYSIHFRQRYTDEYFSIDELKTISKSIKKNLEEYLHYGISSFLYIEIEDEADDL